MKGILTLNTFLEYTLYFFIYAFLGWVCEVIYCYILDRKLVNRGMLKGPICPIYGVGSIFIITLLKDFKQHVLVVFILGLLITSVIEYFSSFILEKAFQAKWWDYSENSLNINGRVCMQNSILFGIMSVGLIKFIHPQISNIINISSLDIIYLAVTFLVTIFMIDLLGSVSTLLNLNGILKEIKQNFLEFKALDVTSQEVTDIDIKKAIEKTNIKKTLRKENGDELIRNILEKFKESNKEKRLFTAFPNIKHRKYNDELSKLKQFLFRIRKK
ncbi:putative ABC transporter permease [Clostridium mediterraneense]|uniref:putative ABC transporter permease n=1 Tax=Clostridium mediterraneense TaxID=1805472 RepID=UPI0008368472|nr:putative ABC transporter permease [Clostridium mediterraneense]